MGKIRWERWASIAVCAAAVILGASLLFRYVLPIFIPFLIAFAVSLPIKPLAAGFSARTKLSRKFCAVLFLILFLVGGLFLVGASARRLLTEVEDLLARLLAEGGDFSEMIQSSVDFFDTVTSKIGFLKQIEAGERFSAMRDAFNTTVANLLDDFLRSLTAGLGNFVGRLISALPSIFLAGIVGGIAAFYFCMDEGSFEKSFAVWLPRGIRERLPKWKASARQISVRYIRAYLLLWLLTFCELFFGFAILRVQYAFLLALVVSFVDLLPILGVGTVLIPWGVVLLIQHRYGMAVGILILYVVVMIVRQIAEPKLLAKSLGLSPLLTLFSTYAGWQLLGFWGMLIAPFVMLLIKALTAARGDLSKG